MRVVVQGGNQGGGGMQWRLLGVVTGCLLFGAMLSALIIFWPGIALFFRWLLAFIVFLGGSTAAILWQRRRWQNRQANTCIRCGLALAPNADQCQCGVASQASFRLDVGAVIAALITLSLTLAGLIVGWMALWTLTGLVCLSAWLLFYYNRRVTQPRQGLGVSVLLRAGLYRFSVSLACFVVWLVWILS